MKNRLTILKRSAMPESLKVSTFTSELRRRLRTTSPYLSKEVNEEIILDMMDDLCSMGYDEKWRENIVRSTMKGWMRWLERVRKGEVTLNRKGRDTLDNRRYKKIL